jgi:hypothetical protein
LTRNRSCATVTWKIIRGWKIGIIADVSKIGCGSLMSARSAVSCCTLGKERKREREKGWRNSTNGNYNKGNSVLGKN